MDKKFRSLKTAADIAVLNGLAFEEYLKQLFGLLGYDVKKTPASGDYGADIILKRDDKTIVVQAKQYSTPAGFDAIKEVYFSQAFYKAQEAWVIATSGFTDQAKRAAAQVNVNLIDGAKLTSLISLAHKSNRHTATVPVKPVGRTKTMGFEIETKVNDGQKSISIIQYHGSSSTVVIPHGVTSIDPGAFASTPNIVRTIPSLTRPFCKSENIVEVCLPDGITSIDDHAFYGCSNLREIAFPNSMQSVGDFAFCGCGFERINLKAHCVWGECSFWSNRNLLKAEIEHGVKEIPDGTFYNCASLAVVDIPTTTKRIGKDAFSQCVSLESVDMPEGVEIIDSRAFDGCTSLKTVNLPKSLKRLAIDAFRNCAFLDYGTPAELFDLRGVEVYFNDKDVVDPHFVAEAFEQELYFERNDLAREGLEECWRLIVKINDLKHGMNTLRQSKAQLIEMTNTLESEKDIELGLLNEAFNKQAETIQQEISSITFFHFAKRKALIDRLEKLSNKKEARIKELTEATSKKSVEIKTQISRADREIRSKMNDLAHNEDSLIRMKKYFKFPEHWFEIGRIAPKLPNFGNLEFHKLRVKLSETPLYLI